ncbi:MAG: hypothetical protein KDE62_00250, partial [Calditrichaeota bacterium]|nr:hypothetical protein [Calditrichota bacterium]
EKGAHAGHDRCPELITSHATAANRIRERIFVRVDLLLFAIYRNDIVSGTVDCRAIDNLWNL